MDENTLKAYTHLKTVRESKTLSLKPIPMLRKEIEGFDGSKQPLKLRYYQSQGIYHLLLMPRMILGDGTGLGKCQKFDTLILSSEGLKQLGTFAPTDFKHKEAQEGFYDLDRNIEVWTGAGMARVSRFYWGGLKPTLRVTTHHGFQLEGTLVHPVLVRGEDGVKRWTELQNLREGDRLCVNRNKAPFPEKGPEGLTEDIVIFLAHLVADSQWDRHLYEGRGYYPEVHSALEVLKQDLFGGSSALDSELLLNLGLKRGVEAQDWCVPWSILQGSEEHVKRFLSVFIKSLYYMVEGGFEISASSEKLMQEVQILLLRFGVTSKLSQEQAETAHSKRWILSILGENARLLFKRIGFLLESKKTTPFEAFGLETLNRKTLWPGFSDILEFKNISNVMENYFFYDSVVKIEPRNAEVMDIEVDAPEHCYVANGLMSHNTLQGIGAFCYLWEKEPNNRVVIVTPKAALRQWESEIHKFAIGITTFVVDGTLKERTKVYETWAKHDNQKSKSVLIVNYHILKRDWYEGEGSTVPTTPKEKPVRVPGLLEKICFDMPDLVTVFDEATAFKNTSTKVWEVCRALSFKSKRCYGLTATLLKNNLMEGFSIYKVIVPSLFTTKTAFMGMYCKVETKAVAGGRKIPVVVGYRNITHFRDKIDPHFLGRPKHVVSDELPTLITKEITCELSEAEDLKYQEALQGILELGDGEIKDYEENKALVALNYCQQTVNSLTLLRYKGHEEIAAGPFGDDIAKLKSLGAKEETLLDLITDELEDDKVIVYTRYQSLVARLVDILKKHKIPSVRITGKESAKERKKNQDAFQDPTSKVRVIFITDAGSEAINLQAASALIFYDAPWSWGNYIQILGRPVRIGSVHKHVIVYHLLAERPKNKAKDRKTIDHHTLGVLKSKKDLIDKVLGESAVGALEFTKDQKSFAKNLIHKLKG
jgi:hypothetical protein